jgi:hypothetical protein
MAMRKPKRQAELSAEAELAAAHAVPDRFSAPMSKQEREDLIQTIIGSQALEGVVLTHAEVARIVGAVNHEPLIDL